MRTRRSLVLNPRELLSKTLATSSPSATPPPSNLDATPPQPSSCSVLGPDRVPAKPRRSLRLASVSISAVEGRRKRKIEGETEGTVAVRSRVSEPAVSVSSQADEETRASIGSLPRRRSLHLAAGGAVVLDCSQGLRLGLDSSIDGHVCDGEGYRCEEKGKRKLNFEVESVENDQEEMDVDLNEKDGSIFSEKRFSPKEKYKGKKLDEGSIFSEQKFWEEEVGLFSEREFSAEEKEKSKKLDKGGIFSEKEFSPEEKRKGKMVVEGCLSMEWKDDKLAEEIVEANKSFVEKRVKQALDEGGSMKRRNITGKVTVDSPSRREVELNSASQKAWKVQGASHSRREADREKAIELAPKFAFFKADDDDDEEDPEEAALGENTYEDWPGPFSTAMKIIADREALLVGRKLDSDPKKAEAVKVSITWTPAKDQGVWPRRKAAPSLRDLCIKILSENVEEIESLKGVPDPLKQKLVWMLCHSRKMSVHVLSLLVSGSSTKIQLTDCSWATEEQLEGELAVCKNENLKVVQLDMCGRCMTDSVLRCTLARSPNCLPALTTLSLKGAYRLTDDGLNTIASSTPLLSSINLSQCSLLTANGIIAIASKLGSVLRELFLDDCQSVNVMVILPALTKLKQLEVLSVARVQTVCDKFVRKLLPFSRPNMRELVLDGCCKLSPASMKVIGENCSRLYGLDICYLNRLNDSAIGYITNGCRSLRRIKLQCNKFSDEAIAAFLEASGGALTELSLNCVGKVGQHTALAISHRCSNVRNLDLSFCRKMTDEALGFIADNCPNLRILKLFGCTQVTDVFLNGHSNFQLKIIGLKEPILEELEVPEFV